MTHEVQIEYSTSEDQVTHWASGGVTRSQITQKYKVAHYSVMDGGFLTMRTTDGIQVYINMSTTRRIVFKEIEE